MEKQRGSYHHGDLKRVLVETALLMLQEQPEERFTLREVARRAGVSHAAPYNHFADRTALMAELAQVGFDRLREHLLAAKPKRKGSVRAEYRRLARAYVGFGTENPALYRLMFGPDVSNGVHLSTRSVGAFQVLIGFLESGQAEGVLRKQPVLGQAAGCWAQLHGITMLTLDGLFVREKVGEKALDAALETLFCGLRL